ncbi:MAG: hypothetical protein B7Z58_18110 [Acidiphilium sp. 37-64-53]|uniref:hypothetical protein n=1 Tax=Acidiphilium sp. 37-64-53 TaxID=1970299 RepID=UPI000BCA1B2E|nr:hypothetical protein [Acidiphilium sp. 37-64-53]OYV99678.1 MAG: hypothetical protein B7Z58_18110 [Acidiphilium sp. 37-64-53]HQT90171.1 hypothetical protein [Acidiphilium sp.]
MISLQEIKYPKIGIRRALVVGLPLFIYIIIALGFFGTAGSWTQRYFGQGEDPVQFIWFLHWWPFAIAHGLNPLLSRYVWFPHGFDFAWATSVPFASLISLPVTLLSGPVLAFNLLSVMAPALSAWTAFLLMRHLTRDWSAALVGGYLFGFSSYELGQMLGHLNLDLTFLVPLAVLLCVRRVRGEIGRWAFVASLAVVLLVELGLSTEILATLCVLGAITWVIVLACAPPADRLGLRQLAIDIVLAGTAMTVLASPFLFYLIKGLADVPPVLNPVTTFSADPLNYFIPTDVTRLGRTIFAPIAGRFTGGPSEQGAYLGLPLVFLVALYFRDHITRPYVRALLIAMCGVAVLSLGPWLHIDGMRTRIPLPWLLAKHLPLIHSALPTRFTMYVALCSAIAGALYLAAPDAGRWRPWRFALAGLAGLCLAPNMRAYAWAPWPKQAFFNPENVRQALGPRSNVLILPFGASGPGMGWQLDAGMNFTQSGGYVGFEPSGEWSWGVLAHLANGTVESNFGNELTAFCATHSVNDILIGPGTPAALIAAIEALGWQQHMDHGVRVVRVPSPSKVRYIYVNGDYWPSPAPANWMGRKMRIVAHGERAVLTLTGTSRPLRAAVRITITDKSNQTTYHIKQSTIKTFRIPMNTAVTVTASHTFVPDRIIHNGDTRHLSVLISLRPTSGGSPGS